MSVNKVILIGNVGKDPDVRYLDNHVCVANLTLATTERGTFIRVTSSMSRATSVTAVTMTRTA